MPAAVHTPRFVRFQSSHWAWYWYFGSLHHLGAIFCGEFYGERAAQGYKRQDSSIRIHAYSIASWEFDGLADPLLCRIRSDRQ